MVLNATSEYIMDYDLQLSAICMCRYNVHLPENYSAIVVFFVFSFFFLLSHFLEIRNQHLTFLNMHLKLLQNCCFLELPLVYGYGASQHDAPDQKLGVLNLILSPDIQSSNNISCSLLLKMSSKHEQTAFNKYW